MGKEFAMKNQVDVYAHQDLFLFQRKLPSCVTFLKSKTRHEFKGQLNSLILKYDGYKMGVI